MGISRRLIFSFAAAAMLAAAAPAAADPVTIRMPSWWFGEPSNKDWLAEAIKAFEAANPDIKIEGYNVPYAEYADQILVQMSSGNAPDIVHLLNMNIGDFLRVDMLRPLDDYMKGGDIMPDTYTPAQFQSPIVVDGKTYGVIHMIANYIPFYNAKLLADAGYDRFPETPDAFAAMVEKLTHPPQQFGYAAMVKPGSYVQTYMDVAQWVIANGGAFATDGKPTIDAPKNVEAITLFKKLFDAGVMPRDVDKPTYRSMWWNGKVAVLFDGSWMMGFARTNNPAIEADLKTAPMPWPGHRTASAFQIWAIPKGAKHPDEAYKFIAFLQSREWQQRMVAMTNAVTPRRNSLPDGYLEKNPWFAPFQEAADKYSVSIMPAGLEMYGNEVLKIIADHVETILYRNAPVDEELAAAQAEIEALIAQ